MSVRRRIGGTARFILTEDEHELRNAQIFANSIEDSAEFDLSSMGFSGWGDSVIRDDWQLPFPATLFYASYDDGTKRGCMLLDRDHDLNPADGWLYGVAFHMKSDTATISIPYCVRFLDNQLEYYPTKSLQDRKGAGEDFTFEEVVGHELSPICYVLQMMSCKNVDIERVEPSRQERRDRERRQLPASNEYRIVVRLPGKKSYTVAGPRRIGDPVVEPHMVRGHFAEYTETGRLFGKYVGRYWIPAHIRGKKQGEEESDITPRGYIIVPGQEAA